MNIDRNDPRLTAYVLDELDAKERSNVEAAMQASPELCAEVEEIRAAASFLEDAFAGSGDLRLNEKQTGTIVAAAESGVSDSGKLQGLSWMKIAAVLLLLVGTPILLSITVPALLNPLRVSVSPDTALEEAQTGGEISVPESSSSVPESVEQAAQQGALPARRDADADPRRERAARNEVAGSELMKRQSPVPVGPDREEVAKPSGKEPDVATSQANAAIEVDTVQDLAVRAISIQPAVPPSVAGGELQMLPRRGQFESAVLELRPGVVSYADKADDRLIRGVQPFNTEGYDRIVSNDFKRVFDSPLSTFSIDVDTASYANMRRFLRQGTLPPPDAVRIEEMINYFNYEYPQPTDDHPFSVNLEVASAPWTPEHRLLRIGLKGRELQGNRPASNLVFLIDVSGSMSPPNKLPLLQQSMKLLVDRMRPQDRVAIAVYAGASGLVLPSTSGSQKSQIMDALERLRAGGSTNGAAGIELAYSIAQANRIEGGINRVILATDGDFNVGVTDRGSLTRLIEEKAKQRIFLSVLGFGMGNLKDSSMEQLADKGNGNYGYIDTIREARKLLVEQMDGTLMTIAKDVKIQVEFNPAKVAAYRLIGYENRALANEDFNDDKKDAGEIGAGHTVTALYEIIPVGGTVPRPGVDPLKYQQPVRTVPDGSHSGELVTVKLRYKQPEGDTSQLLSIPFTDSGESWTAASRDFKFAASVASFGMILRDSSYKGNSTFGSVEELARESGTIDAQGYRTEFLELVGIAHRLGGPSGERQ